MDGIDVNVNDARDKLRIRETKDEIFNKTNSIRHIAVAINNGNNKDAKLNTLRNENNDSETVTSLALEKECSDH